jgi:hypothetical protein
MNIQSILFFYNGRFYYSNILRNSEYFIYYRKANDLLVVNVDKKCREYLKKHIIEKIAMCKTTFLGVISAHL